MIQERAKILPNSVFKYDFEYLQSKKQQSGHTLTSLAAETGRSPVTISLVLNGKCPTFNPVWETTVAVGGDWDVLFNRNSLVRLNSRFHRAVKSDRQSGGGAVSDRSAGGVGRSKARSR